MKQTVNYNIHTTDKNFYIYTTITHIPTFIQKHTSDKYNK